MVTEFKKVFIDTAPFIYFLENNPQYHKCVTLFFERCCEQEIELLTSAITIEEYCVYPYRTDNTELIAKFHSFLEDMEIDIVPIDKEIARKAAEIRAKYRDFKAMDALQLAAATMTGCKLFLTNDKQLRQYSDVKCVVLDELRKSKQSGKHGEITE